MGMAGHQEIAHHRNSWCLAEATPMIRRALPTLVASCVAK